MPYAGIPITSKGQPGGVAALDAAGFLAAGAHLQHKATIRDKRTSTQFYTLAFAAGELNAGDVVVLEIAHYQEGSGFTDTFVDAGGGAQLASTLSWNLAAAHGRSLIWHNSDGQRACTTLGTDPSGMWLDDRYTVAGGVTGSWQIDVELAVNDCTAHLLVTCAILREVT